MFIFVCVGRTTNSDYNISINNNVNNKLFNILNRRVTST